MLTLIVAVLFSFLCGAVTVILAVLFFIFKYRKDLFQTNQKPKVEYEKSHLGTLLHYNLNNANGGSTLGEKETCSFINVLFAFIFREWRDTNQLQKWVLKKINIEFMEFMETKTASRLLQGLKIHDICLGSNFPVFHSVKIKEPFSFTGNELPETVILEVDMEYHGGFFLAIDVDLVFGKTAFLAVRITYLKGKIRLHFGRQPCTHWSLTFVEDPEIKFDVETSFETTQLPQLKSLIVNQIRRTIKRKHTLPHYKMRYNPFFSFQHPESSPFSGFISEIPIQPATLEVCVAAATRLLVSSRGDKERNSDSPNFVVFATISVDAISCVGKSLLSYKSSLHAAAKTETGDATSSGFSLFDTPSTSRSNQPTTSKSSATPFDSIQRSLLGLRKDSNAERAKKRLHMTSSQTNTQEKQEGGTSPTDKNQVSTVSDRKGHRPSISATRPSYVMVALNFGATLREEIKEDGQNIVIVENITEHNVHGQSGMKDGDTVVELNGAEITCLSQAITTIERIRAAKESFKFKVKRNRSSQDISSLDQENGESDKSLSMDTESDHSDVDLDDFKDFVNISLQVAAELNMKDTPDNRRTHSLSDGTLVPAMNTMEGSSRPHSASMSGANDANTDVPYMTLVSSPTPSTSLNSLKDFSAGEKPPILQQKNIEKEPMKKKLNVNKITSPRSRSASPPIFRKSVTLPRPTTPVQTSTANMAKKDVLPKVDGSSGPGTAAAGATVPPIPTKNENLAQSTNREKENLSFARVDDEPDPQLFKTSLVNSNQREYSWNTEKFSFNLKEQHRYLNIRYWTQQIGKHGIIKTKTPQIVGCMSIPLCELEMYCRGVTSRRVTRRFALSAPNELPQDHKWFLNDPVSNRSSFREKYCYGDSTITVKVISKVGNKNNSNHHGDEESAGTYFPNDDTNGMLNKEMLNKLSRKNGSDYLLSAATPSGRKLLVSRETQTQEKNPPTPKKSLPSGSVTGGDQTPNADNDDISEEGAKVAAEKQSLSQIIRGFIHGNKNESETRKNNIEPTEASETMENNDNTEEKLEDALIGIVSKHKTDLLHQFETVKFPKSMKCSYCNNKLWAKTGLQCLNCFAVCHKRCVEKFKKDKDCSDVETVSLSDMHKLDQFVVVDTDAEDNETSDLNNLPTMAISLRDKILDMTSSPDSKDENDNTGKDIKEFANIRHAGDLLAVNAKEMGRDLHRDLPISERKMILKKQTQKVENELHNEIDEKDSLMALQKRQIIESIEWKKTERKITKSDERLQALALLLLHYRAGLEDCEFEASENGIILSDDDEEDSFNATDSETIHVNCNKENAEEDG